MHYHCSCKILVYKWPRTGICHHFFGYCHTFLAQPRAIVHFKRKMPGGVLGGGGARIAPCINGNSIFSQRSVKSVQYCLI